MAIAGFVRKMSGTDAPDTDTMNRNVARMVEEALKYNKVESILDSGEEEDLFSPEFIERLADVKMPATKLEMYIGYAVAMIVSFFLPIATLILILVMVAAMTVGIFRMMRADKK